MTCEISQGTRKLYQTSILIIIIKKTVSKGFEQEKGLIYSINNSHMEHEDYPEFLTKFSKNKIRSILFTV